MGSVLEVGGCREARAWSLQGGPRPMGPGRAGPMRSSVAAPDCCGGLGNLDFRKADLCVMTRLLGYVDPSEPHFVAAVLSIAFNPLFWNVVARWEHKTRKLSGAFGSPHLACYTLGGAILLLNVLRSHWRLLRDPEGGQSDQVPVQRPGQPHVLGEHGQLPGLGHHARQPRRPASDHGGGARLHGCHPVRGALHRRDLPAESLPGPQEELTARGHSVRVPTSGLPRAHTP
nr:phosphatidylethanolamine N-methyltransferase isoform X4 [Kogia breviceps]